jgi:NTP pyrophosphatase (non-canonical NTP hydrolase)
LAGISRRTRKYANSASGGADKNVCPTMVRDKEDAMKELSFCDLRTTNVKRCEQAYHPIQEWSPTDWACAMGGECGEALNLVKKLRRATGPASQATIVSIETPTVEALLPAIGDELADVVIYADLLAARLGLNLGECVKRKFNATSVKIKSPVVL